MVVNGTSTAFWNYGSLWLSEHDVNIPVVLIHGFRGDHHGLERIAQGIIAREVIVPDLPGFGQSDCLRDESHARPHSLENLGQWLMTFLRETVDRPYLLVGHSFGSLVVASALSQGASPARIVLINPISAPALSGPRKFLSQLALGYYELGRRLPETAGNALLRNRHIVRFMSTVMTKTKDSSLRTWIHEQHHNYFSEFRDRQALYEAFLASISHTVGEFATSFRVPTSIIAGDKDDITPLADQLSLAHTIADATLDIVPSVGHLVHYEDPQLVVNKIHSVLQGLERKPLRGHPE